jgi:HTH-type transcriptional regulator/antitoxin HigA
MDTILKYTKIKSQSQYDNYVQIMEELDSLNELLFSQQREEEIELLQLIIDEYESRMIHQSSNKGVELLKLLMKEHNISSSQLASDLNISKSIISEILSYKRSISKLVAIKIAQKFKLQLEMLIA